MPPRAQDTSERRPTLPASPELLPEFFWLKSDLVRISHQFVCNFYFLGACDSSIQTVFTLVNSLMPKGPSSRPKPDCFTPPKGTRGSEATILLMNTMPASSPSMN